MYKNNDVQLLIINCERISPQQYLYIDISIIDKRKNAKCLVQKGNGNFFNMLVIF